MELRDSRVYYGTCSTAASESEKVVEVLNPVFIDGQNNRLDLMVGDILVVKLDNGNTTFFPGVFNSFQRVADALFIPHFF